MSANEKSNDEAVRAPAESEARLPGGQTPDDRHPVPLFLRDGSDGRKGNAQDEKDETGE